MCTILCLFNWKFWSNWSHNWHKLGPMISPHGGENMLAMPGWKLEWIPFHIFHRWNIFVNHLYLSNESRKMFHYTAKRSYEQGLLSKHTQRDTWNNLVMYPLPHSKWGKVNKQKPSGKVLEMNSWGYKNSVKAPTIYSMSTLGRPSLSVDFHVHLQVVATRKRFSK